MIILGIDPGLHITGYGVIEVGSKNRVKLKEAVKKECSDVQVIAYTDNGKWFCDGIGADANCIKNEDIELPIY